MKRTEKKVDRQRYIIEEFNSFNELLSTNDSRTKNFGQHGGARTRSDDYWCGATWTEAVEMLRYGWQDKEKIDTITEKINKLEKLHDTTKLTFKNDIVGYAPIVPLALKGVPQNMINTARVPKKAKVISVIVDVGLAGSVSVREKLDWGAKVVSHLMALEKQGFRVRIDCIKTFARLDNWNSKIHVCKVPIKSEFQPFDIKRLMFPIVHPAMNRRIMFDWYERLPEAEFIDGYGVSLQHHSKEHADAVKKAIVEDVSNSYYISIEDDIEKALKGVA